MPFCVYGKHPFLNWLRVLKDWPQIPCLDWSRGFQKNQPIVTALVSECVDRKCGFLTSGMQSDKHKSPEIAQFPPRYIEGVSLSLTVDTGRDGMKKAHLGFLSFFGGCCSVMRQSLLHFKNLS